MSRGKRYEEPKLNLKKVFAVIIAFVVLIMFIFMIRGLFGKDEEQTRITKEIYTKIINNDLDDIDLSDNLVKEFITYIKTKGLKPAVIVDYNRLAYTYPLFDTRITFDENIKSGRFNYDLFGECQTYNVLEDEVVLEVKFNEMLPSHIARVIMNIPSVRQAISKYALCFEKKEI